jgi:hypothetical protein
VRVRVTRRRTVRDAGTLSFSGNVDGIGHVCDDAGVSVGFFYSETLHGILLTKSTGNLPEMMWFNATTL